MQLTIQGLYFKLHGVHRPVTMKKSIIKRRKRVVPASQTQSTTDTAPSPESDRQSPPVQSTQAAEIERGTTNPDGSVNLGFRTRLPPISHQTQNLPQNQSRQNGTSTSGLQNYSSASQSYHDSSNSLSNDNRLPPMTSYPPLPRQPSLSPNSFLSPSRKRSFGDTIDADGQPKRLSSIKSILNHTAYDDEGEVDPSLRRRYSPGISSSGAGYGGGEREREREREREEREKLERREMLQREAEKMREALKAKERELAEL